MEIVPAIDLYGGQAVRLHQGRYDRVTVYDADPIGLARSLRGRSKRLHVVDLEGARDGRLTQAPLVRAIVEAFGPGVQVGGGVRTRASADEVLALGVDRVVLGTAAIDDPDLVRSIAEAYPHRVIVAVDAKDGLVATRGWEHVSTRTALDCARSLAGAPLAALLYTDVARDGTEVGPNMEATAALAASGGFSVIASGGVGSLAHLTALAALDGVEGVIVGRALYEKTFTLEQAIEAARAPGKLE
jgi:phosphoribosylformimino-5-aminoimidazole carboxamide ribotide isomerase